VAAKAPLKIPIDAAWAWVTLVIILGGILGGIFTASNRRVACIWAFFVTMFIYRDYRWQRPARSWSPYAAHRRRWCMTLIACASSVGYIMALTPMPAKDDRVLSVDIRQQIRILFLINILLLVLGTLVDMAPSILIATPILLR